MAKLPNGIMGHFSGALGPAVGYQWKGKQIIRSKPPKHRGKSSENQLKQMARMKLISSMVGPLANFLNATYPSVTTGMSCFNKTLSYNMRNAIDGDYPSFKVNYARFVLGIGDLLNVDSLSVKSESAGKITFHWRDNSNEGSARATDQSFVAIYCEEAKRWLSFPQGPLRNAGSYILDVPAFSGKAVQTYIGLLSADAKFVTTSLYAGSLYIL